MNEIIIDGFVTLNFHSQPFYFVTSPLKFSLEIPARGGFKEIKWVSELKIG